MQMVYAYNTNTYNLVYHGSNNRGLFTMKVASPVTTPTDGGSSNNGTSSNGTTDGNNSTSSSSSGTAQNNSDETPIIVMPEVSGTDFFTIHAWLLWSAWGVMGFV